MLGERREFVGKFVRFGWKAGYKEPVQTVLLVDICDIGGTRLASHVWLNLTKGFAELGLRGGERVTFVSRVEKYLKGYLGQDEDGFEQEPTVDCKLVYPTKVRLLKQRIKEDRDLIDRADQ